MKIGMLGSGAVAKVLAAGFMRHGHQVMMGTREPGNRLTWVVGARKAAPSRHGAQHEPTGEGDSQRQLRVVAIVRPPITDLLGLRLEFVQIAAESVAFSHNLALYLVGVFAHWMFSSMVAMVLGGAMATCCICFIPTATRVPPTMPAAAATMSAAAQGATTVARA